MGLLVLTSAMHSHTYQDEWKSPTAVNNFLVRSSSIGGRGGKRNRNLLAVWFGVCFFFLFLGTHAFFGLFCREDVEFFISVLRNIPSNYLLYLSILSSLAMLNAIAD